MKKDKLDSLIRQWADATDADEGRARQILSDTCEQLGSERFLLVPQRAGPAARAGPTRTVIRWAAVAAAAAVLLLVLHQAVHMPATAPTNGNAAALASISDAQIRATARVFSEMAALFPDGLRWVATSGSHVQLGIEPEPDTSTVVEPKAFLVRLVVVARTDTAEPWHRVWGSEIVTRSQEHVTLSFDPAEKNRVSVWVHPDASGSLVVDSELLLAAPARLAAAGLRVVAAGEPVEVLALQTDTDEYRVYQTVQELPVGRG